MAERQGKWREQRNGERGNEQRIGMPWGEGQRVEEEEAARSQQAENKNVAGI